MIETLLVTEGGNILFLGRPADTESKRIGVQAESQQRHILFPLPLLRRFTEFPAQIVELLVQIVGTAVPSCPEIQDKMLSFIIRKTMMDRISATVSMFLPPFQNPDTDRIRAFSDFIRNGIAKSHFSAIMSISEQRTVSV